MVLSKFKRSSFWVGVISAVVLAAEAVAHALGMEISTDAMMTVGNAILSILVLLGIIVKDGSKETTDKKDDKNQQN
ncbi:MAG: hypothetical protein IJU58_02885 [Clostridia bacterium]|nr:hypothetical protein [Clostridia bacterium]